MRIAILFSLLFVGFCHADEVDSVFDTIMGNSSQCKDACVQSFPLHTYDKPSHLEACERGCRLFSICEWVDDDQDFNNSLEACSNACDEAYNQTGIEESVACNIGCRAAVDPADQRKNKLKKEDPHIQLVIGDPINSPSHLFFNSLMLEPVDDFFSQVSKHPLMMATDDAMQNMMGFVMHFMQRDSMFSSFMGDPDTQEIVILTFHSPEINTQHPLEKQVVKLNTDGNDIHSKTTLDKIESNLQTNLYGRHFIEDEDWVTDYYDDFDHYENPVISDRFQDWWNCFTKKAGLPEITLMLFWICTMMLLLMCCTMQFPSKKGYDKLSIQGDLAYIKESKGRVPEFLRVYGHPEIVRFTDVKKYKPDETIAIY